MVVTITAKAQEQIKAIFTGKKKERPDDFSPKEMGVRLGVIGGGCSGLSYQIDFGKQKDKDNIQTLGDINVFIDPKASIYLKGSTLDFKDGLQGKGFIFVNPNATNTCGCGESFAI